MKFGENSYALDEIDRQVVHTLQEDAKASLKAIAATVGLSAPAVMERVKKLEAAGIITGYHAMVDARALGLDIAAFIGVSVRAQGELQVIEEWVQGTPEILECHHVTGVHTFLFKVKVRSTARLEELISRIRSLEGVQGTDTMVVLSTHTERIQVAQRDLDPATDSAPTQGAGRQRKKRRRNAS